MDGALTVTLDGERVREHFDAADPLQGVIDRVRGGCEAGRIIVGVRLNGEPLLEDNLVRRLSQPLPSGSQVDLESGDASRLVSEALRDASAQMGDAAGELQLVTVELEKGSHASAMQRFLQVLSSWQGCRRVLCECGQLLGLDLGAVSMDGATVSQRLNELVEMLREVRDAFERRDFVMVSDLIRYELGSQCDRWRTLLAELADRTAPGGAR